NSSKAASAQANVRTRWPASESACSNVQQIEGSSSIIRTWLTGRDLSCCEAGRAGEGAAERKDGWPVVTGQHEFAAEVFGGAAREGEYETDPFRFRRYDRLEERVPHRLGDPGSVVAYRHVEMCTGLFRNE